MYFTIRIINTIKLLCIIVNCRDILNYSTLVKTAVYNNNNNNNNPILQ